MSASRERERTIPSALKCFALSLFQALIMKGKKKEKEFQSFQIFLYEREQEIDWYARKSPSVDGQSIAHAQRKRSSESQADSLKNS